MSTYNHRILAEHTATTRSIFLNPDAIFVHVRQVNQLANSD